MQKRKRLTPRLRSILIREFAGMDLKTVRSLMEIGILQVPKDLRCGAYARSTGRACVAKALPGTLRCKNHGGAHKSESGRKNISDAQKRRWAAWRAERGKTPNEGLKV
jgi:hypothetical protein